MCGHRCCYDWSDPDPLHGHAFPVLMGEVMRQFCCCGVEVANDVARVDLASCRLHFVANWALQHFTNTKTIFLKNTKNTGEKQTVKSLALVETFSNVNTHFCLSLNFRKVLKYLKTDQF